MPTPRRRRTDLPRTEPGPLSLSSASSIVAAAITPAPEEIARRAYELYEQRGRADGNDWSDWFQAEQEMKLLRSGNVVGV